MAKFTQEEVKFIAENYGIITYQEMGRILNRNWKGIANKAIAIGVSKKIRKWTDDELEFLLENYSTMEFEEMQSHLDRDLANIQSKASLMGIKRVQTWTDVEIQALKDNYSSKYEDLESLIPNKSLNSIKAKARGLGLTLDYDIALKIRDKNLKGRLSCHILDHPDFKNDKGLREYCRRATFSWRYNIKKKQKICQVTGEKEQLVVHHLKSFNLIYKEILNNYKKNGFIENQDIKTCIEINGEDLVKSLITEVANKHTEEDGILISDTVHKHFHRIFGNRENSPEQFYEFASQYYGIDLKK